MEISMRISTLLRNAAYAQLIEAKAKHLQAIDFTLGLLRRMQRQGKKFPIDYNVAVKRLQEMRKMSQSGFRLDTLMENIEKLRGSKSTIVLNKIEKAESRLLPAQQDLNAFLKEFPVKTKSATAQQSKIYLKAIAPVLNVDPSEVGDLVIKDAVAFQKAYDAILPMLEKLKSAVDSMMPKSLGTSYLSRIKTAESSFPKQVRDERAPFFTFRDLVGCRILTENPSSLAAAANKAQGSFDIVDKKNYYLKGQGYNAINYNLAHNGLIFEFQLKTEVNDIEANISHDLIYAKEKAVVNLSKEEKSLVGKVIDVSTQLSMRDWESLMNISNLVTSKSRG